jgi:predicted ATP-dependent serine protease
VNFIKTNIKQFDENVGGLIPGKLNLICGASKSGKTLLSSEIISNIDVDVEHYLLEEKEPKYVRMSKQNYEFACCERTRVALDVADNQIMNGFSGLIVMDDIDWNLKEIKSPLLRMLKAIQNKDVSLLMTFRQRNEEETCNPHSLFTMADLIVHTEIVGKNKESKMKIRSIKNRYKVAYDSFELDIPKV